MRAANLPKELSRIKFRVLWIELLHWRKMGMRLLFRMGTQKLRSLRVRK